MATFIKMHKLPAEMDTPGIRQMELKDVPKVTIALNKHLYDNYKVHITFSEEEVAHFFLPKNGVIHSMLVEGDQGEVVDFVSFYALNSSILGNDKYDKLYAAYAFYNFTESGKPERMKQLIRDALILAKNKEFDVFNMTQVLKHKWVTGELLFKPGDGILAHYLYNWRIRTI